MSEEAVTETLRERFGHDALFPFQSRVVARLLGLEGPAGDALVVTPTGSGKSLCFQLPALALAAAARARGRPPGVALVFSPLIALMEDQAAALRQKDIRAAYINSTLSRAERDRRQADLAAGRYELIYATPERMTKPEFADALDRCPGGVNLLAVDEAHCVSQWGHDLRPAYQQIGRFRDALGSPRTVALTATATRDVRDDIRRVLGLSDEDMPLFAQSPDRPNLVIRVRETWSDEDKLDAAERAAARVAPEKGTPPPAGIVYFSLIRELERAEPELRRRLDHAWPGVELAVYHGRLSPKDKKRVSRRFAEPDAERPLVVAATNAFGMGVDRPDIRFITHAQLPGSIEAYAQEIGRAGRDGEPSLCTLCFSQDDLATQQQFAEWANPSPDLLVQIMTHVERHHAVGGDDDGHPTFDADELRLAVVGKGHAHGRGGGVFEYALTHLEKLGCIERAEAAAERDAAPRYRALRTLDDAEIDPAETEAKRKRDLTRLLELVKLARSDDPRAHLRRYFALEDTP